MSDERPKRLFESCVLGMIAVSRGGAANGTVYVMKYEYSSIRRIEGCEPVKLIL